MDMDNLMNFLADNYKWFMIGAGVLLLALIGFLVGGKKKKNGTTDEVVMNQNDFSQMGTLQQAQEGIQAAPAQQFVPNEPVAAAPVQAPTLDNLAAPQPAVALAANNDTIFTGAPVNAEAPVEDEDKLIIEAPTGTLNENINMDSMGVGNIEQLAKPEAVAPTPVSPAAPVQEFGSPMVEAPVAPMPEEMAPVMQTVEAAPIMEAQPVMESVPANDIPISMTPEEPIMQAPVAPEPVPVAPTPVEPAPMYQNTIQQ